MTPYLQTLSLGFLLLKVVGLSLLLLMLGVMLWEEQNDDE